MLLKKLTAGGFECYLLTNDCKRLHKLLRIGTSSLTIDEFARSVGVSTATVSRALSGRGPVRPATRRLVLLRMEELGYAPNLAARSLVTGRTNTVLLACGELPAVGDLFTLEMIRGVQKALATHRYSLLLNAPDGADDGVLGVVTGRAVDGVLLMDDDDTAPDPLILANKITKRGTPCVVIGHRPILGRSNLGSVVIDVEASAEAAASFLVAQGHRSIGFIGSRHPDKMLDRFRKTLEASGSTLRDSAVVIAGKDSEEGRRALHKLLERPQSAPLTAVFARNDSLAIGALQAARVRGLRVPDDLSIVGHDDIPFSALTAPPLTTMKVDCAQVGAAAAEMLLRLFREGSSSPEVCVLQPELIVRETVAGPRQHKQKGKT